MNTPRILLFLLLTAAITRAQSQDNPAPAPATEPSPTEMQKWIATTDAQWQAAFKRDVTDVHDSELGKLKLQYLTSLETGIAKASAAGDLNGALALRNEQKRFGDTNVFSEKDEDGDAASVKAIRAAIRAQLAKLEKDNTTRAKALHAKYDAVLAQAQTLLTKAQRLDDALLVQNKRDEVAAAWTSPAVTATAEKANPPGMEQVTNAQKPTPSPKVSASPAGQTGNVLSNLALSKVLTREQLQIASGLHIAPIVLPPRRGLVWFHLDTTIDNQSPQERIENLITIEVRALCVGSDGKANVTRYTKALDIKKKGNQPVGLGSVVPLKTIKARNNGSEIPQNARVVFMIGGVPFHEGFLSPPGTERWWLQDGLIVK